MKKSDIQIGGEYAVHTGYGKPRGHETLLRGKVIEFYWQEPIPKGFGGSTWRWQQDHFGTRVKLLTGNPNGIYKKGTEHAIQNRKIIAPWADYVQDKAEHDVWAEFHKTVRQAKNVADKAIEAAYLAFLKTLDLDEAVEHTFADGYYSPSAGKVLAFAKAVQGSDDLAAFEKALGDAAEKLAREKDAAAKVRDEKLRELGAEVPEPEEVVA